MQQRQPYLPVEPLGGKTAHPSEYADYKVACLSFIMDYVGKFKPPISHKNILLTWEDAEDMLRSLPTQLMENNHINQMFPVWVYIAVHLKNRHTIEHTGAYNITTALQLVPRIQVELLRMVVMQLIAYHGEGNVRRIFKDTYGVDNPPLDLFDLDSTLLHPAGHLLMWYWLSAVACCFEENAIIRILDYYVSTEFGSRTIVAEHLYKGTKVCFCSMLDLYETYWDKDFLVRFGIRTNDTFDSSYTSQDLINMITSEKSKWPN